MLILWMRMSIILKIAANAIIQYKVDTGTLSKTNANILRDALIRIRTETKFLNSIIKFSESIMAFKSMNADDISVDTANPNA